MEQQVYIFPDMSYDNDQIYAVLPDAVFESIRSARKIVLKPNWVKHSHMDKPNDWDYVITHPAVITAVIKKVLDYMQPDGRITIIDGPEMTTKFDQLISHYPVDEWKQMAAGKNVEIEIIDLREDVWFDNGYVVTKRTKKTGDPRGKTEVNLQGTLSEFSSHKKSKQGYFGADSDIHETNIAHNGEQNLYKLSRTVIESDVFINLPKLKTHKKAGITCCLKNLVGINTYRNYLPHYSIGARKDGGDQFPVDTSKGALESKLNPLFHQYIRTNPTLSRMFTPAMRMAKKFFGSNQQTNRSGSWHGNDTIWRMILDLNKILMYANPDGNMRADKLMNRKTYIGIVDAVLCGEGYGPKTPDLKEMNYIIAGSNPLSVDMVCATVMGFDPLKIPSIKNGYSINNYPIANFDYHDINVQIRDKTYKVDTIPQELISLFNAPSGWKGFIEKAMKHEPV